MPSRRRPDPKEFDVRKLEQKKPENFDLERGMVAALKVLEENKEFFKEMAKK